MQKKVSSGPQAIHIGNRDDSRMLTAVRRLSGQLDGGPERCGRPIHLGEVAADIGVSAENRGG